MYDFTIISFYESLQFTDKYSDTYDCPTLMLAPSLIDNHVNDYFE